MPAGTEGAPPAGPGTSGPADGPASSAGAPSARPRRRLVWHQPEVAWPLALVAGFGGTTLGLAIGLPGLGPLCACVFWAPFHVRLVARGRRWVVALAAIAWVVAIAGAVSGTALETSAEAVRARLFLAGPGTLETLSLEAGARAGHIAWVFLLVLLGLGLARVSSGVPLLLVLAFLVAAVSGAAADASTAVARAARGFGEAPSTLAVLFGGWPPWFLPVVAGLVLAAAAIAVPGRLLPPSDIEPGRRRQIELGLLIVGLGLLAEPLYGPLVRRLLGA